MRSDRKISRQRTSDTQVHDKAVSAASQAETAASAMQVALAGTAEKRGTRSNVCSLEDPDAIPMWNFYQANRDLLIPDVHLYREDILAALRRGDSVEEAFRRYFKDVFVCPADAGKARTAAASRPTWPWCTRPSRGTDGASAARPRSGRVAAGITPRGVGSLGKDGPQPGAPRIAAPGRASS